MQLTRAQLVTELEISVSDDDCNEVTCALRVVSIVEQQRILVDVSS